MKHKHKWFAKDGHIFSEETFSKRSDFRGQDKSITGNVSIAFNVGHEMAEYIVNLHNERLKLETWVDEARNRVTDARDLFCKDAV